VNQHPTYAVVTFGSPSVTLKPYYRSLRTARRDALCAKDSGSCSTARVYECETRKLAKTADASEVRRGERIVFNA